ncbi:MAG: S41 family peptidase [Pseudohongiella nitratireducens]|nr:S41 family peptidase [Pseudohongiella nitratireducens]
MSIFNSAAGVQAQENIELPYPRGPEAISVLREVWESGADSIYPSHLAEQFSPGTLDEMESRLRSNNDLPLADVLNPFLESLNVSHTRFYDRRHQSYYLLRSLFSTGALDTPRLYTIGVQLDEYDPGLVRAMMEGSPAAASGIQRGDRILEVDTDTFESLLQWQKTSSVELLLRRQEGEVKVTLTPALQSFHGALARATRASGNVISCGEQRIGYLHLWSGTHPVFLDILQNSIADARGMGLDGFVLDLRDGYGGAWWEYLDPFFEDRSEYFEYMARSAEGTTQPVRAEPMINEGAWLGPLAVIINSGTRSGKESLAFQFKKGDRAALFGTTTAGAFTAGRGFFAERDADHILYLSVQELILDGTKIEGVGVTPDVVVEDGSSNDAPLAAALQYLAPDSGREQSCRVG